MPQDSDHSIDGSDARKRTGMKALNSASKGDFDTAERIGDIYRLVVDLSDRLLAVERKIDALVRREFLDRSVLSPLGQLQADRFPSPSPAEQPGFLAALFARIGAGDRRFVGIGCGEDGGPCGFFAAELGWSGVLADGSATNVQELETQFRGTGASPLQWTPTPATLNALLSERGFGEGLDLLSIELNGPDYWLWDALTVCRPRVALIAYNSAFGPSAAVTTPYVREFDPKSLKGPDRLYFGASLAALTRLSARKGHRLIAVDRDGATAVFVRDDVAPEIPAQPVDGVFRWAPRHRRQLLKIGDALAYFKERGLPLTTVE